MRQHVKRMSHMHNLLAKPMPGYVSAFLSVGAAKKVIFELKIELALIYVFCNTVALALYTALKSRYCLVMSTRFQIDPQNQAADAFASARPVVLLMPLATSLIAISSPALLLGSSIILLRRAR